MNSFSTSCFPSVVVIFDRICHVAWERRYGVQVSVRMTNAHVFGFGCLPKKAMCMNNYLPSQHVCAIICAYKCAPSRTV